MSVIHIYQSKTHISTKLIDVNSQIKRKIAMANLQK